MKSICLNVSLLLLVAVAATSFLPLLWGRQLRSEHPELEIVFMGGGLDTNPFFPQEEFPHVSVAAGSIAFKNPFKLLKSSVKLVRGFWQASQALKQFDPDLLIGFGSYHTFPVIASALYQRIPLALHACDAIPGKVIRLFAKRALFTSVYFPEASYYLNGAVKPVKMPLRYQREGLPNSREQACAYFGLNPQQKIVLIFGGSQGAQAINEALLREKTLKDLQVLHFTGNAAMTAKLQFKYEQANIPAVVKDFETRIDLAWSAADLAVCRAGANTLAEALEFEVPAILIPYPYAADNHQWHNADLMTKAGLGILLPENCLGQLSACIEKALSLESMQQFSQCFKVYRETILAKQKLTELISETLKQL